ncbi:MAG: hypothetical protein M5U29_09080 [Anaerolineae bacterium]|nr:hypothetical protein [Anaerolineae bacterium]
MTQPKFDLRNAYSIGPTNGTVAVSEPHLGTGDMLIAIDSVTMVGKFTLCGSPEETNMVEREQIDPAVIASLERSIEENREIWAELAKL